MKRLACVLVALAAVSSMGATLLISQSQALVGGALGELKLESVPNKSGLIGAPSRYKVTKESLAFLEKLSKQGQQIEVHANGELKIVDAR